jgi:hypothetical protein
VKLINFFASPSVINMLHLSARLPMKAISPSPPPPSTAAAALLQALISLTTLKGVKASSQLFSKVAEASFYFTTEAIKRPESLSSCVREKGRETCGGDKYKSFNGFSLLFLLLITLTKH